MFILGGADEHSLRGDAFMLHIHAQQWERLDCDASGDGGGGPSGPLFGHSASYMHDGKIYVFGGLTYSSTFDFTPMVSPAAVSPPSGAAYPAAAASPYSSRSSASPLSATSARSAEEEDEEARRRFAAKKLAAKLEGLHVEKPPPNPHAATGPPPPAASAAAPCSANSSPKLVDAAGSPGGGVGHEAEDADTGVETVGLDDDADATGRSGGGGFAWRAMAATGSGLLSAAKLPWKAVKHTGKAAKKVGKVLNPVSMIKAVGGAVGVVAPPKPAPPPTKSQQYGVERDAPEILRPEIDGEQVRVQLGPGASPLSGGVASSLTSPRVPTPGSLLASKEGYALAGSTGDPRSNTAGGLLSSWGLGNSALRFNVLGRGSGNGSGARKEVPSSALYAFDPWSRQWAHEVDVRGLPPSARYMHSACAFPEQQVVYIFGGATDAGYKRSSNDLYKLDLRTHTWSLVPPKGRLPCRRHGHSATNIGHGQMLVFGGANEDMASTSTDSDSGDGVRRFNDTYIFDTSTETWHAMVTYGSAPSPRAFHLACLQADRYLYLVAGETSSDSSDCAILDLNHMVWSRPLFDGSFEHTLHGGVSLSLNNKILVYGGLSFASSSFDGSSGGLSAESFLLNTVEVVGQRDDFTELQLKILVVGAHGAGKTSLIRRFVEDRFVEGKGGQASPALGAGYRTVLTLIAGRLVKIHVHDVPADASLAELLRRVQSGSSKGGCEKSTGGALLDAVDGALLVYDPLNADSLDCLNSWSEQIHAAAASKDGAWTPAKQRGFYVPKEDPNDPAQESPAAEAAAAAAAAAARKPVDDDEDEGGIEGTGLASKSRVRLTVVANKSDLVDAARRKGKKDAYVPTSQGRSLASKLSASFVACSARDASHVDNAFLTMARKLVKDRLAGRNQGACVVC
jgi:GTPase SAR1 family protein/N-acetylneuraminic acid mutarotase